MANIDTQEMETFLWMNPGKVSNCHLTPVYPPHVDLLIMKVAWLSIQNLF